MRINADTYSSADEVMSPLNKVSVPRGLARSELRHISASFVDEMVIPCAQVDGSGKLVHTNQAWKDFIADEIRIVPMDKLDVDLIGNRRCRLKLQPIGSDQWLCMAIDISDLSEKDTALPFENVLLEMHDCVKIIDMSGRLLFVNKAGRKVLSLGESQDLGMKWVDLLPEVERQNVLDVLDQVYAGETVEFSNRSQFPGFETEHWHHVLTPYRNRSGHVNAALCVSRKIGSDFETPLDARAKEERFEQALRSRGLAIWDLDIITGRLQCDDIFYEISGIDPAAAINTVSQLLKHVEPQDAQRLGTDWLSKDNAYGPHGQYRAKFRVKTADGNERQLLATATVLKDLADRPIRAIGIVSAVEPTAGNQ